MYPTTSGKALAAPGSRCPRNRSVQPVSGVAAVGQAPSNSEPIRSGHPRCAEASTGAGPRQRQRPVGPLPCPYRVDRTVTYPHVSVRAARYPALRQSGKHRRTASRSGPGALPAQGTSTGAGRRQRQRPVGPLPRPYRLGRTLTCPRNRSAMPVWRSDNWAVDAREPAQWRERGRAELGGARKRAVRRRTHWPRRPSWSVCTDFSGLRRRVWLRQPHVHTGSPNAYLPTAHVAHDTPSPTVAMPRGEPPAGQRYCHDPSSVRRHAASTGRPLASDSGLPGNLRTEARRGDRPPRARGAQAG